MQPVIFQRFFNAAKQSILAGSLLAGIAGAVVLKAASHFRYD